MSFEESYLGQLRALVGNRLLLVPGTRIVIQNPEEEILLQLRSDFGLWGLPGGNAEPGEGLPEVIEREVLEETGLRIEDARPFGFASDPERESFTFPNGHMAQFFVLNFCTSSFSGSLCADDEETRQLAWFGTSELPEMLPNMKRSIEAFLAFKRTGEFQLF